MFIRWMYDKHFDYFSEQQGNQSVPMQPEENPIEKARRLLKQQKERQFAGSSGQVGSEKDFMKDKNLDSEKAKKILNTPELKLTDAEADHLLKVADLHSISMIDLVNNFQKQERIQGFNKTALKRLLEKKIEKSGGLENLINSEEKGYAERGKNYYASLELWNDLELLIAINHAASLNIISPKQALELVKKYGYKYKRPRGVSGHKAKIDEDKMQMLKLIVLEDKNLASEVLNYMSFSELREILGFGQEFVKFCYDKIKLSGGINNLSIYDIENLIDYNINKQLVGIYSRFISPEDAKKILMRKDSSELEGDKRLKWLQNRATEKE